MAFIIDLPSTIYGTDHPEAYVKVIEYKVNELYKICKVEVATYADEEARLNNSTPLKSDTYTYKGKDFDMLFKNNEEEKETPINSIRSVTLSNVYEKLSTHKHFKNTISVKEEMLIDSNGLKVGDEISLKFAHSLGMTEGIEFISLENS